jgi:hypothetical protein
MTHRIHAAMQRQQPTRLDTPANRIAAEAELEQLGE